MPRETSSFKEQLDVLRSFSEEGSTEEKVEALWRQLLVFKSFSEDDLAQARSRREEAEAAREQTQMEAVRTTQLLCARMRTEAEIELQKAQQTAAEAAKAKQEVEAELNRLKEARAALDREKEQIIAEAENRAEEIVANGRAKAQHETTELRRQALAEIRTILSRIENMREAASEELETQRILTNVAKLKATSRWLLSSEPSHHNLDGLDGESGAAHSESPRRSTREKQAASKT
jgi:dsDNA-specific endonuclease/ATPase MutS2